MPELTLHGRPIKTVYDLLGKTENDVTYSLGWGLSQSDTLAQRLLRDLFPEGDVGVLQSIRLQEFESGGGITDIEIETDKLAVVLEAKVGWSLPSDAQLMNYAPRLERVQIGKILVVSECTADFATALLPTDVGGVTVAYRSWKHLVKLAEACSPASLRERRILAELITYLRGLMTMQNILSNLVYVVALGSTVQEWSDPFTPIEIVARKGRYFHPVGEGYPKEPPNYIGFRWGGRLQQIRHVDAYEVTFSPRDLIPELTMIQLAQRHYVYTLGPAIIPPATVRTGNLFRAQRVYAAIDLLLTSETVRDARDKTRQRFAAAGEGLA